MELSREDNSIVENSENHESLERDRESQQEQMACSSSEQTNCDAAAVGECTESENANKLQATSSSPSLISMDQVAVLKDLMETETLSSSQVQNNLRTSGASLSERTLTRSSTMPDNSTSNVDGSRSGGSCKGLSRSDTEKRKSGRNYDKTNVREVAAEILSERKKKKLIRNFATIKGDGTVEFDLAGSAHLEPLFPPSTQEEEPDVGEDDEKKSIPPLQIVMLIVGTRGDVQPFIAIGKHLQDFGHRVRLATHSNFREFVMTSGLEYYPLGGDPKILAGYMVKNKGFLPSAPSEITMQRKQLKAIINSLLPACTEADGDSGVPFRAQAIIANPPAYGHVHVAEALKVPIHIFFTMPWTPTSEFPHPLARVKNPAAYRLSYQVVDALIWWGIRGFINDFRKKKLKIRPITYLSGASPQSISTLPTGYIWSPYLVPKPKDWGPLIDVVGFCFLNLAADYNPPEDLVKWLQRGSKPIYVGFGSLPVEDPERMTTIIVKALEQTHQRGLIFKGWGGMGNVPMPDESVYLLENCPHDWLFPQCAAVVHHGGAGTTAAGLKAACPTTVVPFFGDQPFWGDRVHAKGVGPPPIPVAQFSLEKLIAAIHYMLDPQSFTIQVKERALELAKCMEGEDGVQGAVTAFHKHLPRGIPKPSVSPPPTSTNPLVGFLRRLCCA
ncbi:hypothetical protein O6H91_21G018300 [Diphasiastrum complanatum]|uniref:Uncharacterized protein n=1 Tax=Diphasiastrum complanatum TaxID=34168 RepID=A0ACC2AIF7_DIPCM|nr:hypothetical protein O6H91_21G018300 [Diphasiastrum complanatum]